MYQDTAGNYDIQYNIPGITRHETSNNGIVVGSYSYVDSNGIVQTVRYSAGPQGFVIHDGSGVPVLPVVPVRYTREVEEARRQHFAVHAAEAARSPN